MVAEFIRSSYPIYLNEIGVDKQGKVYSFLHKLNNKFKYFTDIFNIQLFYYNIENRKIKINKIFQEESLTDKFLYAYIEFNSGNNFRINFYKNLKGIHTELIINGKSNFYKNTNDLVHIIINKIKRNNIKTKYHLITDLNFLNDFKITHFYEDDYILYFYLKDKNKCVEIVIYLPNYTKSFECYFKEYYHKFKFEDIKEVKNYICS